MPKETLAMILTGIECRLIAWMPAGSFNDGVVARRASAARDIITVSSLLARALPSQLGNVVKVQELEISLGIHSCE